MINITQRGDFSKTDGFLDRIQKSDLIHILEKYGQQGVQALSSATPTDSGETSKSWYYEIVNRKGYLSLRWHNSNVNEGLPIAILIQYGHATRNGGWVEGRDYIMPAIRPIFDEIATECWKEVTG